MNKQQSGFTLVELLIVIVVMAILAAIAVVSYNGIQERARDAKRRADITSIAQALEIYYIKNDRYPTVSGDTTINGSWVTTADASWQNLINELSTVTNQLPGYPSTTPGVPGMNTGGYSYDYYGNRSTYCGAGVGQMYIIVYRLETSEQDTLLGDCSSNVLGPYAPSNYRVVK